MNTFYILVFLTFNFVENPVSHDVLISAPETTTLPYHFKEKADCEDAFAAIQAQNLTVRYAHTCTPVVIN